VRILHISLDIAASVCDLHSRGKTTREFVKHKQREEVDHERNDWFKVTPEFLDYSRRLKPDDIDRISQINEHN
jgi:hypothetical protein